MDDFTRRNVLTSIAAGTGVAFAGTAAGDGEDVPDDAPFLDPDRPDDERAADLVGRLNTRETIELLHQYQQPVSRLDVGAFRNGTEALHGVSWLGDATVFPQAIGLGSTWDPELLERVGSAVGDEVRGKHSQTNGGVGLNVWAPTVDPLRDPRWGRNEEGYAEDPLLSGAAAAAYTNGLTGSDASTLKTAPSLKHYAGYNVETDRVTTNAELTPRLLHDYYLPFFEPPIAAGDAVGVMASYNKVNGRPMTASPLLDDPVREWAPDDQSVMNVSDAWAPPTLVWDTDYADSQAEARALALLAGLDSFTERGVDNSKTVEHIETALDEGLIDESALSEAARHVLSVRFRLGEFDPPSEDPYADIGEEVIGRPEHRELAREAARKQAVLLKNDDDAGPLLPLSGDERVAVVGPLADRVFTDWYSGDPSYRTTPAAGIRDRVGPDAVETATGMDVIRLRERESGNYVAAGVSKGGGGLSLSETDAPSVQQFTATEWADDTYTLLAAGNNRYVTVNGDYGLQNSVEYPYGWDHVPEAFEFVDAGDGGVALRYLAGDDEHAFVAVEDGSLRATAADESAAATFDLEVETDGIDEAVAAAADADVAVVVIGNHPLVGARETEDREDLTLTASHRQLLRRVTEAAADTVCLLKSSYPYAVTWADEHVPSILWTSHAGQEEGSALADVLYGDAPPGGRLPQTWPRSVDQLPDITEFNIAEAGTTYRWNEDEPLYPFGHGESYASFRYDRERIPTNRPLAPGGTATVSVRVTNEGDRVADEVVQCYTSQRHSRTDQPDRVLRGFERVRLDAGESATVSFEVAHDDFAFWDVTQNQFVVEDSPHDLWIGSSARDDRIEGVLHVNGEDIGPRDLSTPTRAVDADDWTWSDVELLDKSKSAGTVVGMTAGSWVSFADVDLRGKPESAVVSVARAASGSTELELRRGSPSGTLLGTVSVPSTGGVYSYADMETDLRGAAGNRQTVYLVARGEIRVHTVQLGGLDETETADTETGTADTGTETGTETTTETGTATETETETATGTETPTPTETSTDT
ncbi:glycoside hydrolase family 3 C-terminal domain-containing protein [Haloarcula salina]|uniref:glycoside hydrolase family 3 C-terminal domain-containing protein n=1 Tax=Haloarcula salina TaxID=1429914 RepID=UPI003C6F1851